MRTRKGRLRCDTCGKKQSKREVDTFLLVACWALAPGIVLDGMEPLDTELADHYCSWGCLANQAISEAMSDATPADVIGD